MLIEVLKPLKARLIIGLSILSRGNSPVGWKVSFRVPGGEVISACYHYERRDRPPIGVNALDYGNLFLISRLGRFRFSTLLCTYNNHAARDNTHYKAGLVKVIDILYIDAIFRDYVLYKRELGTNES